MRRFLGKASGRKAGARGRAAALLLLAATSAGIVLSVTGRLPGIPAADLDAAAARTLAAPWLGSALAGLLLVAFLALALCGAALLAQMRGRRRSDEKLAVLAQRDPLTDLANGAHFQDTLVRELQTHAREGRQIAVHRIEIERFGEIRDRLGREAGDLVLREAAARLLRLADDPEHVARLDRAEFAVIQPQVGGARHAEIYAARISGVLGAVYDAGGCETAPSANVGVAVAPEHGTEAGALLENAATALARVKTGGRNGICIFSPDMRQPPAERSALQGDLRSGLEKNWFEVHYQPQYDLASRRLSGFEALLRLKHPERGLIAPSDFIPVAEETGLIVLLGEWMMREACRAASLWPDHLRLSVNLSPVQFRRGDIVRTVREILDTTCLPARRLQAEVPERLLHDSPKDAAEQLQRLRDLGVGIVMDDFGAGPSSLGRLWSFPFDAINIDRSLVGALGSDADAERRVRCLLGVGQTLGVRVVAVGVETLEQTRFLVAHSCRHVQGHLFGRPLPVGDLAPVIMKDVRNAAVPAGTADGAAGARRAVA